LQLQPPNKGKVLVTSQQESKISEANYFPDINSLWYYSGFIPE